MLTSTTWMLIADHRMLGMQVDVGDAAGCWPDAGCRMDDLNRDAAGGPGWMQGLDAGC